MILDFKEIPQANKGGGLQDTFELFARDFLSHLGYLIVEDPDRGADGKRDMIVEERVQGLSAEFCFRWLVSCKHFAHSGTAVKDSDEINIRERLEQHKCDGFMAVYSTLCATSLSGLLNGLKENDVKVMVYDHEKIEAELLKSGIEGLRICARYMPVSYGKYSLEHPDISQIYSDNIPILCDCCGQNLLSGDMDNAIYVLLRKDSDSIEDMDMTTVDMYFACKGKCDTKLRTQYLSRGYIDNGWDDLRDLTIPTVWLSKLMAFLNGIQQNHDMQEPAFSKIKQMFLRTYPYVARNLTTAEKEKFNSLMMLGTLE